MISAAGAVQWLDPKTIASSPVREFDASIYSDQRVARAPLPSLAAGSIIEYEITVKDKAPLLDAGVARRITIFDRIPVERFHVVIDADGGVTLRTAAQLIPENALHRTAKGKGAKVECELGPLETRKHTESNLPPELANYPYLSFSTGKSWQAVAARYEGIVNQRLEGAELKATLTGVDLTGTPREIAARLTAKLHKDVRYTGVEFGEAAILPVPPSETIKRGYGDCKDKATLLVAMLRTAGLKADVALLNSGFGTDVDPELPGMGLFDHAIVYVAGAPPLWIDATATDTRVGFLPSGDQGRLALVANRETTALVKTPEAVPSDTWIRHAIAVKMSEFGAGTFRETMDANGGSFESAARATYGTDEKNVKEHLERYVKRMFAAKSLGAYEVPPRDDMTGPFHMTVEGLRAGTANTGPDDAGVATLPWLLFEDLPWALTSGLDQEETTPDEDKSPRKHDFLLPEPYQVEYRYKISPPTLFKITSEPRSEELKLGPATYRRNFEKNSDGSFEAVYRFEIGKRRLTVSEFEGFREALKKHLKRTPEVIAFVPETSEYLALGQFGKALMLVLDDTNRHKDSAMAHVRLSRLLLSARRGSCGS